ncbi:MAG TPA: DUF5989 family protein [Longimicrobiales bacterium]|nr:DUF5989 family protein [Longimicrobiales bacterium]
MSKLPNDLKSTTGGTAEFFQFLARRKFWFLIPLLTVLVVFALLLVFARPSGLSDLIYPLF